MFPALHTSGRGRGAPPQGSLPNETSSVLSERPWTGIYGLGAVALTLRVAFALWSENTHHPDEVFEYLEQAHRLVFGYGYIPWEYRFGSRCWLLPFFISLPLYVCRFLHADQPAVYVPTVKIIFCVLSTSVVFSVYVAGRNLVSEMAGRLAAVLACFWYELIYFSCRPLADVVAAYFVLVALACAVTRPGKHTPVLLGLSAGLAVVLRIQYLPATVFVLLPALLSWTRPQLARSAVTFLAVAAAAGLVDRLTWGSWFASYYNNYVFNQVRGISKLFGTQGPWWYLLELLVASFGIFAGAFFCSVVWFRRFWPLIGTVVVVVGMHSLIPHKEYRFLFVCVPVLITLTACVATMGTKGPALPRCLLPAGLCCLLLVSWVGMLNRLPGEFIIYQWTPLYAQDPELLAYRFLAKASCITAVLRNKEWSRTGGYYYLHKDIPILFSDSSKLEAYVSHAIIRGSAACPPGLVPAQHIGDLQICSRPVPPGARTGRPPSGVPVRQPGIDDVYRPAVKPFL